MLFVFSGEFYFYVKKPNSCMTDGTRGYSEQISLTGWNRILAFTYKDFQLQVLLSFFFCMSSQKVEVLNYIVFVQESL